MSGPSPNMISKAQSLATTKSNNSTAAPVASSSLNKSVTTKSTSNSSDNMESKMQQSANSVPNTPTETPTQEMCANIIKEAEDTIAALECIGSMFGIPKENIVCDDTLDDIKVQGDKIIAPAVPTEGRGSAIMRSISAVLDYISQRIDAKLNRYQNDNITNGTIIDHIKNDTDPSKGKVIGRHMTDAGDEIIVYDSGLVDMPNTPTAREKVMQLRANHMIPSPSPSPIRPVGVQYFTDEDRIDKDVDTIPPVEFGTPAQTGASNYGDSAAGEKVDTPNENTDASVGIPESYIPGTEINMMSIINESESMLNLVSRYGNTKNLGYEIMTEMGVPGIQPVDFLLEAADTKQILPSDIKHMKFDNSHIMKSVRLFNEARAEQKDVKGAEFDINKMVNSPNWHKAIQELEKQFNCHIVIHYLRDDDNPRETTAMSLQTGTGQEYRQNVTVSKSKGFQLNGLPISIYLLNNMLIENAPTDPTLFGQATVALLLHEIFHNIMGVFREYNAEFNAMLTTTMITATMTKNAKVRRKLITNFANAVDAMNPPGQKMSLAQRRTYIKKLLILCSLNESKENMKLVKSLIETDDTNIDIYLDKAEAFQRKQKLKIYGPGLELKTLLGGAVSISFLVCGLARPLFWPVLIGGLIGSGTALGYKLGSMNRMSKINAIDERTKGTKPDYEEHWADMFAAMYNLPVNFFMVPTTKVVAANMTDEQIKRLHKIEMNWVNLMGDEHPPTTERLAASVKFAKQTLESGAKINPEVKKYLEWIIANHSRILEVEDIDNLYSKATFDPKTAEDIDLHIGNLISKTNAKITEQST